MKMRVSGSLASMPSRFPHECDGAPVLHGAERLAERACTPDLDDEIDAAGTLRDRLPPLRIACGS
jgi:hypothetical protein